MAGSIRNDRLAAMASGNRAQAGARTRIPAPPPDEAASPFAGMTPPHPEVVQEEMRRAAALGRDVSEVLAGTPPPRPRKKGVRQPIHDDDNVPKGHSTAAQYRRLNAPPEAAHKLIDNMLGRWAASMQKSIPKANADLARELMRSGSLLIKAEYPIDVLSALVRLSNDLAGSGGDDNQQDARLDALREMMEKEMDTAAPENADVHTDDEEQPSLEDET